jgi:hypothetical protein
MKKCWIKAQIEPETALVQVDSDGDVAGVKNIHAEWVLLRVVNSVLQFKKFCELGILIFYSFLWIYQSLLLFFLWHLKTKYLYFFFNKTKYLNVINTMIRVWISTIMFNLTVSKLPVKLEIGLFLLLLHL